MIKQLICIVLFSILSTISFANNLIIDEKNKNKLEINKLKILHDKQNIFTIEHVLENRHKFENINKTNLGLKKYPLWTYSKIINNTSQQLELIFTNPRAGIDFIDVYILDENKIIKEILLGDMRNQEQREFIYRKSSFLLNLKPYKQYDFLIKYKSFGAIDINWKIHKKNDYISYMTKESLVFGFIAGFVVLISTYIIFFDRLFPSYANKIYFGIMISTLLMQFSIAGIFYQLGINSYFNTIFSWTIGNLAAALVGLFPIYFFNLRKIMPKTTILLKVLSYSILSFAFIFLFYPLKNDLLYLAPYANVILLVLIITLFIVSFRLFLIKVGGAFFYLLANSFFTLSAAYFVLGLLGLIEVNSYFYFSLGIGSILNILGIGMLIVFRLLNMKRDKENALIVINEQAKLSNIGQAMVNISHQWKEPINHIHYAINNIYAAREFNDPNLEKITNKSLEQIKTTTNLMANTGNNFLSLYKEEKKIEKIDIATSLSSTIKILKKQMDDLDVTIITKSKRKYYLYADKYLLSNVFLTLLENAIKVFKNRQTKKPYIEVETTKKGDYIFVIIQDNAGGIKQTPINSIFEKDLTTLESTGLGLFLAKNILTIKLDGNISAKNTEDGAYFEIVFKV